MFYSPESSLGVINAQLARTRESTIGRTCFYRLRRVYCLLYGVRGEQLVYDDSVVLYLYYCAKARNRVLSHKLLFLHMQDVDATLAKKKQKFCDAFPSFSSIDSHFLNARPIAV